MEQSTMEYLFIEQAGDREMITQNFAAQSISQLIEQYNTYLTWKTISTRALAQRIIGLYLAFQKLCGASPIVIIENAIISLSTPIEAYEESWRYCTR